MDQKSTVTLVELAAKSLLSNESIALHSLHELPRDVFVTLFVNAFSSGRKKILKAIVNVWPFYCLHVGMLSAQESYYELLEFMVEGLQIVPASQYSHWWPKLRILDLRQDPDCETVCSYRPTYPFCFQSCIHSRHCIRKVEETQHKSRCLRANDPEYEPPLTWEPMEVVVDLAFDGSLKTKKFLSCLQNKIDRSYGSVHLCCRNMQIEKIPVYKNSLKYLDLGCIDHLEVNQTQLREINTHFEQMTHLDSLSLSNIHFKSYKGRNFKIFLSWLEQLNSLQELNLSGVYLKDQMNKLLRVMPHQLDVLCMSFCNLSTRDIVFLSQSYHLGHLKLLNLSNNPIFWSAYEPFLDILEKTSGTLQHLEVNNCLISDSALSTLVPTLKGCSHLRVLSFAFNPITMSALVNLVTHLKAMLELKYVIYPVPVHCYDQRNLNRNLDQEKLAEVQTEINVMLQSVEREDMSWTTCLE